MSFDRATFYTTIRKGALFDGTLSTRQVTGMEAMLDAFDKSGFTDLRWLAYILGTAYHETGRAMYPVREGGLGKGHPYGVAGADGQVAYGRGFVQLTWAANYAKADKALGLGGKLVANFDLALDPATAAQIIVQGMADAWFTAFRLSDYLNDTLADYLHARRIVNGMDEAQVISGYALTFFSAITAGVNKASDHSATVMPKIATPAPTSVAVAPAAPPIVQAPETDPLSEVLSEVTSGIGSIIASGGVASAPAAPSSTLGTDTMNPLVAISIIKQVMTYGPMVEAVIAKVPDIVAKGEDAIKKFEAMDFQDGITDVEAIVADLGISQTMLSSILQHATVTAPPATAAKAA